MAGNQTPWIAAGTVVLLLLLITNFAGEKNASSSISQEEVKLLRERVAQLESKLGATLVNNGRSGRSASTPALRWDETSARGLSCRRADLRPDWTSAASRPRAFGWARRASSCASSAR